MLASLLIGLIASSAFAAKEIALTFDDAPVESSGHFKSIDRTKQLIRTLAQLQVKGAMIFANPCKDEAAVAQLKLYRDAGHWIGNHSCSHPRFEDVGFERFTADVLAGEEKLKPLMVGQKMFRFPYFNESKDVPTRDRTREWLKTHSYVNAVVTIDNDDYLVSGKINQAMRLGKKIDYKKIEKVLVDHLVKSVEYYDALAVKALGRSPKHVMLLHEVDATVMYLSSFVKELRKRGWTIIDTYEAYKDPVYNEAPRNTSSGDGIIAQLNFDQTGEWDGYEPFNSLQAELNKILELK